MAIIDSRQKSGELKLTPWTADGTGTAVSFACQATSVKITPSYDDDGDRIETLCGDVVPPGKIESWTINGTSVQDFDNPEGFVEFCWANAMKNCAFEWQANKTAAPTIAGECVVIAVEEGGDVGVRLTTDWEFECLGRPTRTPFSTAP